jgi:Zn-dependent protease
MHDPLNWSLPLFRAFGIQVRLHILYIIITLGMLFRTAQLSNNFKEVIEFTLIWVVMLFVIILLHEFGHCFAARRVNGEASEILMWPLGGLAFCEVPHTPRANFICAFGGPLVNLIICAVAGVLLMIAGYLPPMNPFQSEHLSSPELYAMADGKSYIPNGSFRVIRKDDTGKTLLYEAPVFVNGKLFIIDPERRRPYEVEFAQVPGFNDGITWTARVFYLSWVLFLFNLLPAFPLDGGRFFQCYIWRRSDYRTGTTYACYSGYVVAILLVVVSIGSKEPMTGFLAIFIWFSAQRQLMMMQMENEGAFGYDFSQGYTSLNRDEEDEDVTKPQPKPRRPGPIGRWLQARRERRKQREEQERIEEQARMDELLDKVHREGLQSLTDEERKFMNRVSAKYKNRS